MKSRVTYSGDSDPSQLGYASISGIDGNSAPWDLSPENDPFPSMLNPDKWESRRIAYPALAYPMGASIDYGIAETISQIRSLPPGRPFALGGYSQGAAVMAGVYNELRYGTLTSRLSDFLGAVMFGNPRRQQNHRGIVGGTWSGSWDVPGSTVDGHGSFPATGPWARLQNCGDEWIEFTAPTDMFSSVGGSATGINWTSANAGFLNLTPEAILAYFTSGMLAGVLAATQAAFAQATENTFLDAVGKLVHVGGGGHTEYPFLPPVDDPYGGATSYQIALAYLDVLADAWATAPIALPSNAAGWSTTLLAPA